MYIPLPNDTEILVSRVISRYETAFTTAYMLWGKDVDVELKVIMRAQLDQRIDNAEKSTIEEINVDPLNPPDTIHKVRHCMLRDE